MPLVRVALATEPSTASVPAWPSGRVTLLFTDIEDSSRMTKALGDLAYRRDLRDPHCQRIRAAVADYGGTAVKTIGDSFMLAFPSTDLGLACAAAIQKRLTEHPLTAADGTGKAWEVRVRIGVHTAERELQPHAEGDRWDYTGTDVNFAARVESLGAGGQILVSDSAYRAGASELYQWQEWPNRRIKSFDLPETVWELLWDGRSRGEPGSRWLPKWFLGEGNRYIARPAVESQVLGLFGKQPDGRMPRLITIHGFGGMGKTRLAVACALQAVGLFDSVFFVRLDNLPLATKESVAEAIGEALEWRGQAALPDNLFQALRERNALLVLDNYESVDSEDVQQFVGRLITKTRELRLLVTGRESVKLDAEHVVDLDDPRNEMTAAEARALFIERARQQRGQEWTPDKREKIAIRRVIKLTAHIPLALELAAAWAKLRSLEEIAAGISATPLGEATTSPPRHDRADSSDRHRSLTRCLDWSFKLLKRPEQNAFARFGIFADSFTAETAAKVCDLAKAQAILYRLQQASLVRRLELEGNSRYTMIHFTRSYAAEKLAELPGADSIRRRFVVHYLRMVSETSGLNSTEIAQIGNSELFFSDWNNAFAAAHIAGRLEDWDPVGYVSAEYLKLLLV
jgi:class 3 adenylate cyclase/predicted ATPase